MKKKTASRPKQGGIRRYPAVRKTETPENMMKGTGPTHGGPGFGKSLPTHQRVNSGPPTTHAT
jgi:hypothetical protein